jgi:type IV secretion system protein VirB4
MPWLTRFLPPTAIAAARMLPPDHLIGPTTIKTRRGTYLRVWQMRGVSWESESPETISARHEALCAFFGSLLGRKWRVSRYRRQRQTFAEITPIKGNGFAALLNRAESRLQRARPFLASDYFTVLEFIPKRVQENITDPRTLQEIDQDDAEALRDLDSIEVMVERALRDFSPVVVGEYLHQGRRFSRLAEVVAYFATGLDVRVRADCGPLYLAVSAVARVSAKRSVVEVSSPLGTRFAAMLGINEYKDAFPSILAAPMFERVEFLETQVWEPMLRRDAIESLQRQQNHLRATESVSPEQHEELQRAAASVDDGKQGIGHYGYVMAVFGASIEEAQANADRVVGAVMQSSGIQLARIDLLPDRAWYFQVPGNFNMRPRKAEISSRALAALSPDHDTDHGKRFGHPWDEALRCDRTQSGRHYWWSLHASHPTQNASGKPMTGITVMTGINGSGKSLLLNLILAQTARYNPAPRLLLWDMHRANELFVRAMYGHYCRVRVGVDSGVNPFQRPRHGTPSPQRIQRLAAIVEECVEARNDYERQLILTAVTAVTELPWHERGLSAVRQMLLHAGEQGEGSSLHERLGPWCRGGPLGWVLDGEDRLPDAEQVRFVAIDYTEFLDHKRACGPMVAALTDYSHELINGERLIVTTEEAWRPLDNERLAALFERWQLTVRKFHGLCINVTQQPVAFLRSRAGRTMVDQAATFIALADEHAKEEIYAQMGYTPEHVRIIRELRQGGVHRFLLRQDTVGPAQVLEHDLSDIEDINGCDPIAILSGTPDNVQILDEIRARVGDDPKDWMPLLGQAIRERKARQRIWRPE